MAASCGGERVVQEKIVDLGELLDELCAFLGGQFEGRGWYLVRSDGVDTVDRRFEIEKK